MRDLTQGSIPAHLINMAAFIGAALVIQTLYFIVDLYFVSQIGSAAVAGVSAAGNVFFLALAVAQMISVGALSLVSQAIGRKDGNAANLYSDQSVSLSLACAGLMLLLGYAFGGMGIDALTADDESAAHGKAYLHAFIPSLALMFPVNAMVSSLRGAAVVMPVMLVQTGAVILNAVLCPILIAGWGAGLPLGAAGAGWASSIASLAGALALIYIFPRVQTALRLRIGALAPNFAAWRAMIFVGLPTALEFAMMFVIFVVIYWVIRDFGATAQAGVGIGGRISQSIFLPAMAVAFAVAPVAGQNFGAKRFDRVRETFRHGALISCAIMLALALLCHVAPALMARPFTADPAVIAVTSEYLQITSWNFIASGVIMTAGSLFQGMGDTRPSLLASATRLLTFVAPALWLSGQPGVALRDFWLLSVASVLVQCACVSWLLVRTFKRKLAPDGPAATAPAAG